MSKTKKALKWMKDLARDPSHGYDQAYRWGQYGDYDCSSAVISAWDYAGVPVKSRGATYTGNMKPVFLKCGFADVTRKVNLATGSGLLPGDVLLNYSHHAAMYIGDGMEVEASVNEKGTARGGRPGDQTGREILVRTYRNFPWDCILRWPDKEPEKKSDRLSLHDIAMEVIRGRYGNGRERIDRLKKAGYNPSSVQKKVNLILKGQS